MAEHKYPTPLEWYYFMRKHYRAAKSFEDPARSGLGQPDWVKAGRHWNLAMAGCECTNYDGVEGGPDNPKHNGTWIQGFDVRHKSEQWRRAYFEVLMGSARAAEHLEGWVYDTRNMVAWSGDQIIGPSNPNRKPTAPTGVEPPREEFCRPVPYWRPADIYYNKIATMVGFTSSQNLQGAIGCGDWALAHSQPDVAYEKYKQAFDIATKNIPNASTIVDTSTGIIQTPSSATANIIQASTSMATYYAQTNNYANALPAYLSVLRARRAAPTNPPKTAPKRNKTIFDPLKMLFIPPEFPPVPPTGDEPFARSAEDDCEDAVLMTYIGEILYAINDHDSGLRWTRDAIAQAEECARDGRLPRKVQNKGLECAQIGLRNMKLMVAEMAEDDVQSAERRAQSWRPRWLGGGNRAGEDAQSKTVMWTKELEDLDERSEKWREEALRRLVFESKDETFNPIKWLMENWKRHG
ncbi:hypothetical protein EJ05DRAFT_390326 [Pseudovirgaria hyperparasitica]|uniref:Uncharacterized protein n=1 Tax=Pseudovirgaria hyperparasitica TaxID=470096 RepID=A0A6A6W3D5_9PEZI|nr:uncharacterized protein EJ05DRAFT_390326 [Pseudovirgaria hyperparasitica]KAF2757458.1 hypothetical protein EJ05DRAFT_390326 [Pseudovirgaria hyperparasitica]